MLGSVVQVHLSPPTVLQAADLIESAAFLRLTSGSSAFTTARKHQPLLLQHYSGQRVLLDADLATLYDVTTKRFNEQVKRNLDRFPEDFMFQLTEEEFAALRSQFATSNQGRGGRRYLPYAFTEHGTIMVATILNSQRAMEMSVYVVRTFVQLRNLLASNQEVMRQLTELGKKVSSHALDGLPAAWRSWLQVPTDAQNDRATSPPQNTNCKQRWLNQYRPRSFSTKPTTTTKPTI